ncbi:MAG: hypothetical protein AAF502_02490 [Bacteroidota bacterium]
MHRYILGQRMKHLKVQRESKNFADARRIGILFDASRPENQVFVNEYRETLIKQDKKVEILGYFDDKQPHNNVIFKYFNKKNLTWFWIPKSKDVEAFINTPFDILISLHLQPAPQLEYVSALSKAHMRVGLFRDDKQHCYDLMIDNPESQDLKTFTKQVDYLLNIINRDDQ